MNGMTHAARAAIIGVVALAASSVALAHDRARNADYGHHGHGWGHSKRPGHSHRHHVVVREQVVIQQPPQMIYERRAYYPSPAIVVGIDIPPLVIPLR